MHLPHSPLRARTFAAAVLALPVVLSSVALFAQEDDVPALPEHARTSRAAVLHGIAAGLAAGKPQSSTVEGLPGSLKDLG